MATTKSGKEFIPPIPDEELERYEIFQPITFRGIHGHFIQNCLHYIIIYQPYNGEDGSFVEIGKQTEQCRCIWNVGGIELLREYCEVAQYESQS
jgi:hypothetical protein